MSSIDDQESHSSTQEDGRAVFSTASSADRYVVTKIATDIGERGIGAFAAVRDIEHGDDFEGCILDAALACAEQAVLLTPWAIERPYVWLEIGLFRAAGKRTVVILHGLSKEEFASHARIPVYLECLDVVELNDLESYLTQLEQRSRKSGGA